MDILRRFLGSRELVQGSVRYCVWRRNLVAMTGRARSREERNRIEAALRFLNDGWAEKALALGWTELELFGVDPRASWTRLDRMGAAYSPFEPSEVNAETIVYPGTGSQPMRHWRGAQTVGAELPELRQGLAG